MNKQGVEFLRAWSATVLASILLACAAPAWADDTAADAIELVKPGTLTVCTHLPYKPFEYVDKEQQVVGFDVDLAGLLATELGVDTNVISIDWNQITSGAVFAAKRCDMAMGGATITAKRAEAVQFTNPYFNATQVLLAKKDAGISGLADLQGKRLGVQVATTGKIYAEDHAEEYGYEMVVFEDLALETAAVSAGSVDAAIQDSAPLLKYASEHPDTAIVASFDTGEQYGFMAKKDDANATRLVDKFNAVLAQAKADGTYDEIFEKWFGDTPEAAGQ